VWHGGEREGRGWRESRLCGGRRERAEKWRGNEKGKRGEKGKRRTEDDEDGEEHDGEVGGDEGGSVPERWRRKCQFQAQGRER
jgi:hypothetical protein